MSTAKFSTGKRNGEKRVILTLFFKNSQLLIFYCAPILSRKDNGLLIRKNSADSLRKELQLQINQEMAGDY